MKALISPNEKALDPNMGEELGARIAEVVSVQFDVAEPLFWIDCDNGIGASTHYFDVSDQSVKPIPEPIYIEPAVLPPTTGVQTF